MKANIKKVKSIFGRHNGYVATMGDYETESCKTQSEALEKLESVLEQAMTGTYTPYIVSWRGNVILVARRAVSGWGSRIIMHHDEENVQDGDVLVSSGDVMSRKQAIDDAKYHLAQIGWKPYEEMPDIVPEKRRGEFLSWMEFQNRYHEAVSKRMTDGDAHSYAGRNPARRDLWDDTNTAKA